MCNNRFYVPGKAIPQKEGGRPSNLGFRTDCPPYGMYGWELDCCQATRGSQGDTAFIGIRRRE
eukprot:270267-Amorphochlora_amoeboformis.AAC.1